MEVMMEREADAFVSDLLMPSKLARPMVNQDELSLSHESGRSLNTSRYQ